MNRALSSADAPPRSDRGGVPAPGCLVALMVPIVLVLLAAGTLMAMAHRQNSANERHEQEALERMRRHVESFADDVRDEARNGYPSQAQTRVIARRNHGTLVSYEPSDRSLTTRVKFFATYGWALTALAGPLVAGQGGTAGGEVWIGYQTAASLAFAALLVKATPAR